MPMTIELVTLDSYPRTDSPELLNAEPDYTYSLAGIPGLNRTRLIFSDETSYTDKVLMTVFTDKRNVCRLH